MTSLPRTIRVAGENIWAITRGLPCLTILISTLTVSSATATVFTGYIEVNDTPGNYVSNAFNDFGEAVITDDPSMMLLISFDPSSIPFSINITDGSGGGDESYFGGIQGYASTSSDFGQGSYNYSVLGGTAGSPPGSVPTNGDNTFTDATALREPVESAIWSLSGSNLLTAQWVNSDGSNPVTHIEDVSGILVLTGDPAAFANVLGGNVDTLTFVCTDPDGCIVVTPEAPSILLVCLSFLTCFTLIRLRFLNRPSGTRCSTSVCGDVLEPCRFSKIVTIIIGC
jgi:hypothetical protein